MARGNHEFRCGIAAPHERQFSSRAIPHTAWDRLPRHLDSRRPNVGRIECRPRKVGADRHTCVGRSPRRPRRRALLTEVTGFTSPARALAANMVWPNTSMPQRVAPVEIEIEVQAAQQLAEADPAGGAFGVSCLARRSAAQSR